MFTCISPYKNDVSNNISIDLSGSLLKSGGMLTNNLICNNGPYYYGIIWYGINGHISDEQQNPPKPYNTTNTSETITTFSGKTLMPRQE